MSTSRFVGLSALLFALLGPAAHPAAAAANQIEFVLDLSGSMRQFLGGRTQVDLARDALLQALKEIPPDAQVALRLYGHRIDQNDKAGSCRDSELVVPFSPVDAEAIRQKLLHITPLGYTPIAYSLAQAALDFAGAGSRRTIILLSDGEETCGGDPIEVIRKLKEKNFDISVHTIGFNVDQKTRAQLKAIAQAADGQYFDAGNAQELGRSLRSATKQALLVQKQETIYGSEIRGGDSFETAVPLEYGKEYRLSHHQRRNEYDYFVVDLKPGQEVTAELRTYEKGISVSGDKATPTDNPYAGIRALGPDRKQLGKDEIIGQRTALRKVTINAAQAGPHYLLLGSEYDAMNKDHVTFKLALASRGDLGGNEDAPDKSAGALPVTPGKYPVNYIGGPDLKDLFVFNARQGEKYFVGIIPEDGFEGYLSIRVLDEYKRPVISEDAQKGAGTRTSDFEISADGAYVLEISLRFHTEAVSAYAFELKKVAESPVPAPQEAGL